MSKLTYCNNPKNSLRNSGMNIPAMLRKFTFLLQLTLLCATSGLAQLNNSWILGYNQSGISNPLTGLYKVNFAGGNITYDIFPTAAISFRSCNTNISDSAGNLLFYTNGIVIMNALNDTMLNGDSLSYSEVVYTQGIAGTGMLYPQTILILPAPSQPNIYYVIHQTFYFHPIVLANEYCDTLFYSIVDMTQDSGRGAVVSKNNVLWTGNFFTNDLVTIGGMSACKHANGRDWWIVTHKDSSNIFMTYLLTPTGLNGPYLQTISPIVKFSMMQAGFSPDGSKYVYNNEAGIHLFEFNRCTGIFYGHQNLGMFTLPTYGAVGTAFSPNSQVLYASGCYEIYQWDLSAANVQSTKTTICVYDSTFGCPYGVLFYQMQTAPDGKIYVCSPNSSNCMSVINDPDVVGPGCNAVAHGLSTLPYYNGATVPYFPNFELGPLTGSMCDSLTTIYADHLKLNFEIYPNPANDLVHVKGNLNEYSELHIVTITGQNVLKTNFEPGIVEKEISLESLSKGMYFWILRTESGKIEGKLCVQ